MRITYRTFRHDTYGVTTERSHTTVRRCGHDTAMLHRRQIRLDIGHCLRTIALQVTLGPTAVAARPFPLPPPSLRFPPTPFRISIGDNVGETSGMERTASCPGGPGACHDDVCGPDGSCCSRLDCSNVIDYETKRRIAKRHRRRRKEERVHLPASRDCAIRWDRCRCSAPPTQ